MGGTQQSKVHSNNSLNIKDIHELTQNLGTLGPHQYATQLDNFKPESNILVGEQVNIKLFNCSPDSSSLLNDICSSVGKHINQEFLKENWFEDAFPQILGDCLHRESKLTPVEDSKSKFQGYVIYEMPENTVWGAVSQQEVSLEECFLGREGQDLNLVAPHIEPKTTRHIRFNWEVEVKTENTTSQEPENETEEKKLVEGEEDKSDNSESQVNYSCVIKIASIEPVEYETDLITRTNDSINFSPLKDAYQSFSEGNSRQMTLYTDKFKRYIEGIKKEGENLMVRVGGDMDGDMLSLTDFISRMEL